MGYTPGNTLPQFPLISPGFSYFLLDHGATWIMWLLRNVNNMHLFVHFKFEDVFIIALLPHDECHRHPSVCVAPNTVLTEHLYLSSAAMFPV